MSSNSARNLTLQFGRQSERRLQHSIPSRPTLPICIQTLPLLVSFESSCSPLFKNTKFMHESSKLTISIFQNLVVLPGSLPPTNHEVRGLCVEARLMMRIDKRAGRRRIGNRPQRKDP